MTLVIANVAQDSVRITRAGEESELRIGDGQGGTRYTLLTPIQARKVAISLIEKAELSGGYVQDAAG